MRKQISVLVVLFVVVLCLVSYHFGRYRCSVTEDWCLDNPAHVGDDGKWHGCVWVGELRMHEQPGGNKRASCTLYDYSYLTGPWGTVTPHCADGSAPDIPKDYPVGQEH